MKKGIVLLVVYFSYLGILKAQELNALQFNQNPNHEISLKKYDSISNEFTRFQGTTFQDTYKAIDPLEEKLQLRAQRPLRRHQRALARAKNTRYVNNSYDPYYTNSLSWGYNYDYYNYDVSIPVAIGFGLLDIALWTSCYW